MATKIGAWIRDPKDNLFKGMSKRAALFELYCNNPDACDLLKMESTCLHCGAMERCKFGSKVSIEGPTRKAQNYYSTLEKWRKANEGFLSRLLSLRAYNRVFKANGHYYLPYSWMTPVLGGGAPLQSKWVTEEEMTTDLLARICTHVPMALFGGAIADYQKKEVPKFISDLHAFYPEVFALLPDDQKARLGFISYVGRKADLITCNPGRYRFGSSTWEWDGTTLIGKSMLFQPVEGDIAITIRPKPGQPVEITDNAQVGASTRFLD